VGLTGNVRREEHVRQRSQCYYSYRALWNAFKRLTAAASPVGKHDLFYAAASRIYRLDLPLAGRGMDLP
jgi:hypothetical protein